MKSHVVVDAAAAAAVLIILLLLLLLSRWFFERLVCLPETGEFEVELRTPDPNEMIPGMLLNPITTPPSSLSSVLLVGRPG
jgi:hypothetical protein